RGAAHARPVAIGTSAPRRADRRRARRRRPRSALMADIVMPRLSDTMEEGTILRWLKADGDTVRRGEELVEIETDKAAMTYESDQDGILSRIASEGDTLPVGEVIARVGADGDAGAAAGAAVETGAAVGAAGETGVGANGDAAAAAVESIVEIAGGGAA